MEKKSVFKVDGWTIAGVFVMGILLLFSIGYAKQRDNAVAECNEYWISNINSGHVLYYGDLPNNYTFNTSTDDFIYKSDYEK